MSEMRVKYCNELWYRVTELAELFFYTLYGFKAYWIAGKVDSRTANLIKGELGISIKDFSIELKSDDLNHFLYSHFNETRNNQRGIHFKDINELPNVVNGFSNVDFGNKPDTLLFEKTFPTGLFQLVVEINYTKKKLVGKSFRIKT